MELLRRDPQNYLGRQRLILGYLRLKQYPQALKLVNECLKAYPTDATFLEQKGFALQEQGNKDEARKVLSLLLLVSPKNAYARTVLGTP